MLTFKDSMEWYNEPPVWEIQGETITVTSGAKTDFWRQTHYGFIRDNGHFFYQPVQGDFIVEVKVSGEYRDLVRIQVAVVDKGYISGRASQT